MRLCAVSVDLDEIPNYFEIHSLGAPKGAARTLVYDVAIDRLLAFSSEMQIPLTFFAIGRDLARETSAAKLRNARDAGFEIANHSLDHRYDLVRLGSLEIRRQVVEGARAIERATGTVPVGFRAPGYTVSDSLLDILAQENVAYDSSVFPCPAYAVAKAAGIARVALRRGKSRSILDTHTPAVLCAPSRPYRVGRPYWRRGSGILEMPIQVTPRLRLPFIGTTLTLLGRGLARRLARACVGEPLVNLELHGIDVLDSDDGLRALRPHQPDVRVACDKKLEALRATVGELATAGYVFVTMHTAAQALASAGLVDGPQAPTIS